MCPFSGSSKDPAQQQIFLYLPIWWTRWWKQNLLPSLWAVIYILGAGPHTLVCITVLNSGEVENIRSSQSDPEQQSSSSVSLFCVRWPKSRSLCGQRSHWTHQRCHALYCMHERGHAGRDLKVVRWGLHLIRQLTFLSSLALLFFPLARWRISLICM